MKLNKHKNISSTNCTVQYRSITFKDYKINSMFK